MKKVKYYYNTHTLRYEKLEVPLRVKLLRVLGFLAAAIVTAFIIVAIAFQYLDSPKEKMLRAENEAMKDDYELLDKQIRELNTRLRELETRDNEVYRSIFEANPIPDSARAKQLEQKKEEQLVASLNDIQLARSIASSIKNLTARMDAQKKSYGDIEGFIKNKEDLLASTPAIQPVSNADLKRLASGFGYRIDPIYKMTKFHAGLDFSAPQGTPVYASANGTISVAGNLGNGYGNHVVIRHGYGYETLYGHLYKIKARNGQKVKRGEIIGYVGSTGKSTGPHLHYEVHRNGVKVDPIYYFYNDLSPEQFDRMLKMAAAGNQSFD
ncbi:M23 family metallopeptidase [Parasegetibacter sp. NRK P23]|uniref:M23 family metallopeptidase n=1 Tax=Parasegetibacter sp. NRK P23 TaxID=2942999 RepID=UPI0020441855|nr:M23 family metallopeptidase [Parasegetibacter sp. NRK P23]MCM5529495.1 M23 family metallopeptidase [Parasegetibacter sp. NRK P23]